MSEKYHNFGIVNKNISKTSNKKWVDFVEICDIINTLAKQLCFFKAEGRAFIFKLNKFKLKKVLTTAKK